MADHLHQRDGAEGHRRPDYGSNTDSCDNYLEKYFFTVQFLKFLVKFFAYRTNLSNGVVIRVEDADEKVPLG